MSQSTEVQKFPLSPAISDAAGALAHRVNGLELRVVLDGLGEPWFVARDVCSALLVANVPDAVGRLDSDERKTDKLSVVTNDPSDDLRKVNLISEAGLYSLIMTSRVPTARAFKRWVTHEVLPAIRKTGVYATTELHRVPTTFAEALELAAKQARALDEAYSELTDAEPKVEAFDELMSTDGSVSLATAAQLVGLGRATLIERLARWGAIISRPGHSDHLRPYQSHVKAGRFVIVAQAVDITHRDGTSETLVKGTTRVTAKGVEWIRQQIKTGGPRVEMIAR